MCRFTTRLAAFALVVFFLFAGKPAISQVRPLRFGSPNGKLEACVFVDSARHLAWSLSLDGHVLVEPSALGIDVGSDLVLDLGQDVSMGAPVVSVSNSSYLWKGVHSVAVNHYRQARIPIAKGAVRYTLECRVFDDGFAFRYLVPGSGGARGSGGGRGSGARVTGESSAWHLPDGSRVWYQENIYYYEGLHYSSPVKELGGKHLGPPVTFQTPDGLYGSITEAALYNYSGMSLRGDSSNTLHAAFVNDPDGWVTGDSVVSPWRVILASATLDGLVNSDIIADLNPGPELGPGPDRVTPASKGGGMSASGASAAAVPAWIKPGRAVWSYFVHDNVTTLSLEKNYVDKAAALGFEYSIVDAGWDSSWPNAYDSLSSLVHYAGARHIRIFVWKSYASLKDDSVRKAFFSDMHRLGVAGLKIDYIDKEGIDQVRFYEKALRDGLAYHLLIDFHGANKPTGYNRHFPNELTREGIYGQEWRTYTPQGPINNAIIPFTRFLAGPADYTPGVFNSALAYGTSRAQQLALPVIYNSPLLCWADDPALYLASPAAGIVRSIPTTWDETRVLAPSRIGEIVVFARRKGADWFLALINAGDEKRIDLPLDFLGPGAYKGEIISDDFTGADRILRSVAGFSAGDTLPVLMQARGGFVAHFTKTGLAPARVAIEPAGGYLLGPQKVRIAVRSGRGGALDGAGGGGADAVIRYTTDGSLPDSRSPVYTGALTIGRPALVRAQIGSADVVARFLAAPAPAAEPDGGIFVGEQAVQLSTKLPGEIRYTTDGSDPNVASPLYKEPVLLNASTMLKSRVFFGGGGASEVSSLRFQRVEPDAAVGGAPGVGADGGVAAGAGADGAGTVGPGLRYAYYEGKWDSMPRFSQLREIKHGHVLIPSLDSISTRVDEYGLQFKGWIDIPTTGVYTFYTISDDGSQLYIGDQKVVDNDGCHGDLERSGDRALMAGKHPITINYFQSGSGQSLQVFIKGPGMEKQSLPAAMLSGQ